MRLVCETCQETMTVKQAWVEWLAIRHRDGGYEVSGFRICHHAPHSPHFGQGGNCYRHYRRRDAAPGTLDLGHHLDRFTGRAGLSSMMAMLAENGPTWRLDTSSFARLVDRIHGARR